MYTNWENSCKEDLRKCLQKFLIPTILAYMVLYLLSFIFFLLSTPPSPLDLKSSWWDYLHEETENYNEFREFLEQSIKNSPEEKALVDKIKANLHALEEQKKQPPFAETVLPPALSNYTVEDLLTLYNQYFSVATDLQYQMKDAETRTRRIDSAESDIAKLRRKYDETEKGSKERLHLGLQLIDYRLLLLLADHEKVVRQREMEDKQLFLQKLQNRLDAAKLHLQATEKEVGDKQKELQEAITAIEERRQNERDQIAKSIQAIDFSKTGDAAELNQLLFKEEMIQNEMATAIAENSALQKEIELLLLQLRLNPDTFSITDQQEKFAAWKTVLDTLQTKRGGWNEEIDRLLTRSEMALSLGGDKIYSTLLQKAESLLLDLTRFEGALRNTAFLLQMEEADLKNKTGGVATLFFASWNWIHEATKATYHWLNEPIFYIGSYDVGVIDFIQFAAILLAAFWISRLTSSTILKLAKRRKDLRMGLIYSISRLAHYFIMTIGFLIALSILGFDFSSLVLVASALGVGLGFGLQAIFNNFVSGLIILFENQLKVGDYVELESGTAGEVREINARSTYIKTNDGIAIIVPNSEFVTGKVVNWTHRDPYRRVHIPFGVGYGTDKKLLEKVVGEAALAVPITLKAAWTPEPHVYLTKLGDSALEFEVAVWVDDLATKHMHYTHSLYLNAIHDALVANNIEIPFPQMEVKIKNPPKEPI